MAESISPPTADAHPMEGSESAGQPTVHSLRALIDLVTGRKPGEQAVRDESYLSDRKSFPFLAMVGQEEMKTALLLALINPAVSGVLLIGSRGTGKTTAVRSLVDLLPEVQRSTCIYGCLPEDIEEGGTDAVCPDCAAKHGQGLPITRHDPVRLVELPLNVRLVDVIGDIAEGAAEHERQRLRRGILSLADQNILYCDEINLLDEEIVDAILDASAQGSYTVRQKGMTATYRSRFILVGSMNPEEGNLRPQIMDRFGLRVYIQGLKEVEDRLEAYRRAQMYRETPRRLTAEYSLETRVTREEINAARQLLEQVAIPQEFALLGIELIRQLQIDSLWAEISLFEAARAHAAADNRRVVEVEDIKIVAPMALRLRNSSFLVKYFEDRNREDRDLQQVMQQVFPKR